jgi:uncharacterized protein YbjT (DUF2867 family)
MCETLVIRLSGHMTDTHLVLGGTGKTGTRLARHLVAAGAIARPGSRTPAAASTGVQPVRFDWDDDSTWGPALDGVTGVYLVPPALRMDHPPLLARLAEQAVAAGVRRLVLLSARGVDAGPENPLIAAERAVQAVAGDRLTVIRPAWFMQNFTEAFFASGVASGVLVAPSGDGAEPFIDADDIAAVAAAALTDDGHAGRTYELSGPEALTFAQAASVFSQHFGHEVRHVDLPISEWIAGAEGNGLPAAYAGMLGALFGVIRDGHDAYLSTGVQDALGRPPTSLAEWAQRVAETSTSSAQT